MTLLRRLMLVAPLLSVLTTLSAVADAANVAPRGKVRVGLETEVFSWTNIRPWYNSYQPPEQYPTRENVIGFGPGRPVTIDGRSFGGGSVIAFGVAYGVHRHVLLGARFGMNLTHGFKRNGDPNDAANDDDSTVFVGSFTPYLEILPLSEGRVLPFILLRTGFSGTSATERDGAGWNRAGAMAPLVGIGAGLHGFVTSFFSIDFSATLDYRWFYGIGRTGGAPGIPGFSAGWGRSSQSFTLAAVLGVSTWF